jgi:hypothetical protein
MVSFAATAGEPKCLLSAAETKLGEHHTHHLDVFGHYTSGYNLAVLAAIDKVQSCAMDGGGYFIGVKANPPESPIGYELRLFGKPLLSPPRTTSYCSGASCSVFIEAINQILSDRASELSPERLEAMRMQEPDGSRREDGVKFWGHWNDDGFGTHFALVQYTGMGEEVSPQEAQPGTNGLGDQMSSLDKIKEVKFVRLTHPEKLFTFNVNAAVDRKIRGDKISFGSDEKDANEK